MKGTAVILQGNALALPLPDASVDLICTSPPYFGLRSYQDNGEHYAGQLGSEATPTEFLDALIAATREMVRVLKPSGSIWVNLGDKYSGAQQQTSGRQSSESSSDFWRRTDPKRTGIPTKSLTGIPWRYALRCIDDLGLILRAEIIWSKPNGLPESVTDRVRRSHEQWFHFTVQPRYFSAVDEIREEHLNTSWASAKRARGEREEQGPQYANRDAADYGRVRGNNNPLGKLPGSVWTIPTQPLEVPPELGIDHFAAYPMEWPRRLIQGWTPTGICVECGEGRRPVANAEYRPNPKGGYIAFRPDHEELENYSSARPQSLLRSTTITGYMCGCQTPVETTEDGLTGWVRRFPPTRPAVILDPFGGTGTTALVAKALGRTGISVDLSADYCRLAAWRCNDPGQLAAALQVEKPEPISPDQLSLFGEPA